MSIYIELDEVIIGQSDDICHIAQGQPSHLNDSTPPSPEAACVDAVESDPGAINCVCDAISSVATPTLVRNASTAGERGRRGISWVHSTCDRWG